MKNLQFHYHMELEFSDQVWHHTYTLKCMPKTTTSQEITECSVDIIPGNKVQKGTDSFGNVMLYGNVDEPHSLFSVDVRGKAQTGISRQEDADDNTDLSVYRYQTPLTRPGERIKALHRKVMEERKTALPFREDAGAQERRIREQVRYYMESVHENMNYTKGVTGIDTTAEEALQSGKGVCQDYAHILLSLCREERIPARYVVGMLLGEGESHAWIEAFDGKNWIGFDPTNNLIVDDAHIKISHGRDYQDCSINRGVFTGQARQKQRILVEVREEEQKA